MTTPTDTGFEGLSAFATDVDGAIAAADRIAAAAPRAPAPRTTQTATPPTPVHRDGGAIPAGLKKVGGWVLGIGVLLAIKACIWGGVHAVSDSGTSSYTTPPTDQTSVYDSTGSSTETSTDNMTIGDAVDSSNTAVGDAAAPEDDGAEAKPMPGYAGLSLSEIRYCMAEDIRISAQKTEIDGLQYTDTDRFNRNVDGFNEVVNDYNSRCSNGSIMASDRPTATSQVEAKRTQLETEGRSRVQ